MSARVLVAVAAGGAAAALGVLIWAKMRAPAPAPAPAPAEQAPPGEEAQGSKWELRLERLQGARGRPAPPQRAPLPPA